jgi:hypothetical protein
LNYGSTYNWTINSKNKCYETSGPVQTFVTRHLPDLIVNHIQLPSAMYSGQDLNIEWEIKNIGIGVFGIIVPILFAAMPIYFLLFNH